IAPWSRTSDESTCRAWGRRSDSPEARHSAATAPAGRIPAESYSNRRPEFCPPTVLKSSIEEVIRIYDIGEKPGVGRYCCTTCGWSVQLDDATDRLPPCGSCGRGQNTTYNRC